MQAAGSRQQAAGSRQQAAGTAATATATCPQVGATSAATTIVGLELFGSAATPEPNGPPVVASVPVVVPGLVGASLSASLTRNVGRAFVDLPYARLRGREHHGHRTHRRRGVRWDRLPLPAGER
ncbi:hypothetical protein [Micromonospora sp. NPDC005203]|uniref:hypothetical protein n=1 Tax=Micromonospora sp. NPDC005203 TaxID=3364226 RepID=UPI003693B5B4